MEVTNSMDKQDNQYRSHTRHYWIGWITILFGVFVARLFGPPRFRETGHFDFAAAYMFSVWLPIMLVNFYEGRRLMGYLKEHHPAKWAELTTFLWFGPGWVNGFRSVPWLFSSETLGDPAVAQLKCDYRKFIYFALTVFFTFPIFFIVLGT